MVLPFIEQENVRDRPNRLWNGVLWLAVAQFVYISLGLIPVVAFWWIDGGLPWELAIFLAYGGTVALVCFFLDKRLQPRDEVRLAMKAALWKAPFPTLTRVDMLLGILMIVMFIGGLFSSILLDEYLLWLALGGILIGFYTGASVWYPQFIRGWRLAWEIVRQAKRQREKVDGANGGEEYQGDA